MRKTRATRSQYGIRHRRRGPSGGSDPRARHLAVDAPSMLRSVLADVRESSAQAAS